MPGSQPPLPSRRLVPPPRPRVQACEVSSFRRLTSSSARAECWTRAGRISARPAVTLGDGRRIRYTAERRPEGALRYTPDRGAATLRAWLNARHTEERQSRGGTR